MRQSPLHTAIVMDGNGRWAGRRRLPRAAGHRAGARTVRTIVEHAPALEIRTLTLFAFSADNWARPQQEVDTLMRLFESYLRTEAARCVAEGVKVNVIGRRDRLSPRLVSAIEAAESASVHGTTLELNLAVDYSSRDAIRRGELLPDVDLLIRTGGELRLSDFLLWECAYAELVFTQRAWPDFTAADLTAAVTQFQNRDRRFGALPQSAGDHLSVAG